MGQLRGTEYRDVNPGWFRWLCRSAACVNLRQSLRRSEMQTWLRGAGV